jgi:hypothetical protein
MMVDFPTLGFPMILTKPALCDIKYNSLKISAKIKKKGGSGRRGGLKATGGPDFDGLRGIP